MVKQTPDEERARIAYLMELKKQYENQLRVIAQELRILIHKN